MQNKQFMVVRLPKDDGFLINEQSPLMGDYDHAFEEFNNEISQDHDQHFKQPKGEKPLRAVLSDKVVELWVITRNDELFTTT